MKIEINQKAPNFSLPDQEGEVRSLSDYKGKWVLLYFYPKDDTPGCTKQACGVRDNLPDFKNLNAVVLGISSDTVESHKKFAEKYNLPFTLLSDETKETIKTYDSLGERNSFLIDSEGIIVKIYEKVNPADHAKQVLSDLSQF